MADPGDQLEHLRHDLDEARAQLAATTEVLTTVGKSTSDLDAVLKTVVRSARRLCRAQVAQIHLVEGDKYRLASWSGHTEEYLDFVTRNPIALDRRTLIGRIGIDRLVRGYGRAQQIMDVLEDPEYGRKDIQEIAGYRSILGVPMILDDEVVGVLSVWRTNVDPFSERAVEVLTTFAAQAAIAIRNVDLVCALEARQEELAAKVEQLEALGHIGQAVSSSLDLDQVLNMIVTHAVQLSDADGGSILEFDEIEEQFEVRTVFGADDELVDVLRGVRVGLHETFVGRAALQHRSLQIADLRAEPIDLYLRKLLEGGWLSVIAAPIVRDDRIVGALMVRRRTAGRFSESVGELLETFAGQSAMAIVNARLFRELERKSAELERKGAELEVASKHKSEFLASMSHELRTPLNAVIGFSQVLLERMFGELNERQDEYVRDILESGRHLLELLNEILDLSKIEAGRMELSPTAFPVREALEYGTLMIRESAASRGVKVNLDVDDSVDVVDADEQRFKQVVLNLLSNAVKFTRQRVDVSARSDGTTLTVSVADDGPGVAPEDRTRIFESFQQGRQGASVEGGTGLGLTLVKRLVGLHGGEISLNTELGVGSTFSFTIPVTASVVADEQPAEVEPVGSGLPVVVIVEDDPHSLDLLRLYVERAGVEVLTAGDGGQGLELIRRVHPAAVVLDIQLPTLDGWDLLALLKADPDTAPIPVVVVSMMDERGKGFALGAAEYLVKPVSGDEVRAVLARVAGLPDTDRTLLSIGEDPALVELIRAALEPEGWTVLSAISGPEGVEVARSRRPTVVLVDLLLTGEDGLEVVEVLGADPSTVGVPIIALTSQTMTTEDKERLRGQIEYVTRNGEFDPALLVDSVHRATRHLASSAREPS